MAKNVDLIFHDCETSVTRTSVHAHYQELISLPADVKKKMWLYHYQPGMDEDVTADGFLGLVKKGQEYNII